MGSEIVHYGVKGMKWGHHKDNPSGGSAPSRKVKKADAKFERNANSVHTFIEVHNRAAAYANEHDVDRINNKPQYKNADFTHDSPLRRKYFAEHEKAFNDALKIAANSLGTNASGTRRYTVTVDNATGAFKVHTENVMHAEDVPFEVIPKFDSNGHIISFSIQETKPVVHYGVKGMHWGVRKQHDDSPNPHYSERRRAEDQQIYGKGGVKRINRRMNQGQKLLKAQQREAWRTIGKGVIAVGSVHAARIVLANKNVIAQHIAVKAETERGRSAAAQAMGLPRKPTHGPSYSKKSRGGAYKITSI